MRTALRVIQFQVNYLQRHFNSVPSTKEEVAQMCRDSHPEWGVVSADGGGPYLLDSLMVEANSDPVRFARHQAVSTKG